LPHQYWRGRIELRGGYTTPIDDSAGADPTLLRVGLGLEHESDHATDRSLGGFLSFHDVLAFGELDVPLGAGVTLMSLTGLRALFLSCTRLGAGCSGADGDGSVEVHADVRLAQETDPIGWFVSVFGAYLVPHGPLIEEWRIAGRIGVTLTRPSLGTLQLYGEGMAGNDVGLLRADRSVWAGGGLAWTP
jgi:hypothetical protein